MISSSDQQVVVALRVAAGRIVVPPEERWVRERRSAQRAWVIATLALALVALIAAVGALRSEPRTVPGSGSQIVPPVRSPAATAIGAAFDLSDNTPWIEARGKAAPDFIVLKPTWLPSAFDSASQCAVDVHRLGEGTSTEEYHVFYTSSRRPCWLALGGHRDPNWSGDLSKSSLATFVARGGVVYVREQAGGGVIDVLWLENGAFYEVSGKDFELGDLIRVVNSLEPMR